MKTQFSNREYLKHYTIWRFQDLKGNYTISARLSEPNDKQVQHEYQKVLAQVLALTKEEALLSY
jgi:hypothetical protein